MSLLAHVKTDLGRVELHHEAGVFTTQRRFTSAFDGDQRTTTVRLIPERAREWYELCAESGAVHADWPEAVDDG
jgi:hypothetical protein